MEQHHTDTIRTAAKILVGVVVALILLGALTLFFGNLLVPILLLASVATVWMVRGRLARSTRSLLSTGGE